MNREDYLTHLFLAGAFFGVLGPFLFDHGMTFGSGLYYAGTAAQVSIASMVRFLVKE